ncbi:MAG: hypothetical protein C5B57_06675 [Blastocatellia bacterium]|nr:MAG: hypothetical protein C5B57_06675 [Blastocatellia bacterium]
MREKLPARILPLLYLGTAHIALALGCLLTAIWPQAVAGFFYHSWLIAIVHLVTLGWITFSILGAIFIVGPLALRMSMPARRPDYVAYAFAVIGLIGMVGHFWIQEYAGMAWSAATVTMGIVYMTIRIAAAARGAHIQPGVRLHITLACANLWLAASMGLAIAIDKVAHFLPGYILSNVFAHAHLAALGWATMMVMGVGYRLLPMTFPSKMPGGRTIYLSAILLETGVLGLFVSLLLRSAWAFAFGIISAGGLLAFGAHVVGMLRQPARAPDAASRFNFGLFHTVSAGVSLSVAIAIGLTLLVVPISARTLHAAAAYGVLGLVGFLAQMVVAMEARLLPMVTWSWAYAGSDYRVPPPSPHAMRDRLLQGIVLAGWTIAVPALTAGMYLESARLVSLGAWSLLVGVAIATTDNAFVVAYTLRANGRVSNEAA